jgi:erythromycin esterase-like protein
MKTSRENDAAVIREAAQPIAEGYKALVESAASAQCVLIGEASHGTHEFYSTRAELTRRLISEHGFRAVAVEADWPDSFRVHRFVTGRSDDKNANDALSDFRRFPGWMWRNTVVVEFVEWLREWNSSGGSEKDAAGFYGLDLYSMHSSIEAVLSYLDKVDPLQRNERGAAMVASIISVKIRSTTGSRPSPVARNRAKRKSLASLSNCAANMRS